MSQLSIAKTIRLELDAESEEDAQAQVHEMCERLLANPVIEQYTVEIAAVEGVPAASMNGEPA